MNRFTDFAQSKDAVAFKEAFTEAVAAKVVAAIDAKKVEIAANMFESGGIAGAKTSVKSHGGKLIDAAKKGESKLPGAVKEDIENVEEAKIEMTRGGRATGNAIKDIIAKNNARLAKKKAAKKKASEE